MAATKRGRNRRIRWSCEPLEERIALASAISVASLLDDGTNTLREAIVQANRDPGSTISFDPSLIASGPQAIALASALPELTADTTITGPGQATLTVQGGGPTSDFTILQVAKGVTATISGLTFSGANTTGNGGAIANEGELSLVDCTLSGNNAVSGGGLFNSGGSVTLTNCTLSGNTAFDEGGGTASLSGSLTADGTTWNDNHAGNDSDIHSTGVGGGIASGGTLTLTHCTISQNSALTLASADYDGSGGGLGGGIDSTGTATITASTISGNAASESGGGIYGRGLTIEDSEIDGNHVNPEGRASYGGRGVYHEHAGGGVCIANSTLSGTAISDNDANKGGGVYSAWDFLVMTGCTITGNTAKTYDGGAIRTWQARLYLTDCTVSGNTAADDFGAGGGIFAQGSLSIRSSTISGNTAAYSAGGIYSNCDPMTLVNSTVYGNTAAYGGGLIVARSATATNCTIAANRATGDAGGGAEVDDSNLTLFNTLVAGNFTGTGSDPGDILGALDSAGTDNLIGDGDHATGLTDGQSGNRIGTTASPIDPRLGPLADNGGPTQTVALLAGSPAVDAGDNSRASALGYDQRGKGYPRILNRRVDIGAYESPFAAPADQLVFSLQPPADVTTGATFHVTVSAENDQGLVDPSFQGSVTLSLGNNPGHDTLGGTVTETAVKGVATFSSLDLTVVAAGYVLAAKANGSTLHPGTSALFQVVPLATSRFTLNFPATTTAGDSHDVTVTAFGISGNVAIGYRGTVHFTSSDTHATLPADYTFTAADAGKHIFSATLKTAGTWAIRASDAAHPSITGLESGIAVAPAPASRFGVAFPASTVAGVPHTFTVTVFDPYGNVAKGYIGTVHFTSDDTHAALPADYPFVGIDAGQHTFTATLETAGPRGLRARDTAHPTITGLESGIVVEPASAARFAVSYPPETVAGVSHDFVVTAYDPYGNVASGYLGTAHLTSSDTHASLPVDYTFTVADAGHHSFPVVLKTAGTWAIRARDTTNPSITGLASGLVVAPAAAARMVVAGYPTSAAAGASHTFVVTFYDAFGNVATGYRGTIHFISDDPMALLPADWTFTASDAGTWTLSATFKTRGTHGLRATDTQLSSLTGSETGIVVS
jgi:hypothetical protein